LGLQTPVWQVLSVPHSLPVGQGTKHAPSAQTLPPSHSLLKRQVSWVFWQEPATQASPLAQSVWVVHAQGPAVPPQASHLPALQVLPCAQSVFCVHSLTVPGVVCGATHWPDLQTVPLPHWLLSVHEMTQPWEVQSEPGPQAAVPVQGAGVGLTTGAQS